MPSNTSIDAEVQKLVRTLKPDQFQGRSISVMHRQDQHGRVSKIALVEALVKVCFDQVSTDQFLSALKNVFNLTLEDCSRAEELAFIQFYTLPTSRLKCRKIICIDYFAHFYDRLKLHFTAPLPIKRELDITNVSNQAPKRRKLKIEGTIDLTDESVIEIS